MRLAALLALFVIQGTVLSFLIPAFQNPDEQIHYGTVQHWAEPKEKTWKIKAYEKDEYTIDTKNIRTSNLPEEMVQSAHILKFNELTFERQNIQNFSDESLERQITENNWKRYVNVSPSAVSGTKSVYYLFASWLERFFSDESIFTRIFSMRVLGVAFGAATVLLMYLTVRKIGFSEKISLIFTVLVAFQPMFAITAAQVNIDIALVFSFSLFLYAGVSFLKACDPESDSEVPGSRIKSGMTILKFGLLAVLAAVLGFFSKGPGIVLVVALYPLFVWGAYQKYTLDSRFRGNDREAGRDDRKVVRNDKVWKFFAYLGITTVMLVGLVFFAAPKEYLASITNATALSKFDSPLESIGKYLDKTIDTGEFRDSSLSYWGNFGWLDTPIPGWILSIINWIEIVGFVAVLMYLLVPVLSRVIPGLTRNLDSRFRGNDREGDDRMGWLPERRYLVFFLGMILALQLAIRFYDWRVFDATGQVLIGQPGRYFLPNLIGHLVLVVVGVGLMVSWVKRWIAAVATLPRNDKIDFEMILKIFALAMILLELHAIVNVIIPRYYL